jgi:hypothetical protein
VKGKTSLQEQKLLHGGVGAASTSHSTRLGRVKPGMGIAAACLSLSALALGASREAQTLLRDGKRLMAANQLTLACPKLAESQSLAPSASTLVQLALCHEKEGKNATALQEFKTVQQQTSAKDPSAVTARQHVASLQGKVAHFTVKVPDLPETRSWTIYVDSMPLEPSAWNVPQPVDPGSHKVSVTGKDQPWTKTFAIGKGADQRTIEIPARPESIGEATKTAKTEARLEDPTMVDKPAPTEDTEVPKESSSPPIAGYVVGGLGVVAVGVGSYFGVKAISQRKDSDRQCSAGCTQAGVDLNENAKTSAWVANIAIGGGVVMAGIGAYLLLKSGDTKGDDKSAESSETSSIRVRPEFTPTTACLTVRGVW